MSLLVLTWLGCHRLFRGGSRSRVVGHLPPHTISCLPPQSDTLVPAPLREGDEGRAGTQGKRPG